MGAVLNPYAVNQLTKGVEIYMENEYLSTICLVLKGRVLIQNDGSRTIVGSGSFIGILDLYSKCYKSSYIAYDDVVLYPFEATKAEDIYNILASNKDYPGLLVAGIARNLVDINNIYIEFDQKVRSSYSFLSKSYTDFKQYAAKVGYHINPIESLESLEAYPASVLINRVSVSYYKTLSKVPMDIQKSFFSCGEDLAIRHVSEVATDYSTYANEISERATYLSELLDYLIGDSEESLFYQAITIATEVHRYARKCEELDNLVDKLIEEINSIEKLITSRTSRILYINRDKMEKMYSVLLTGTTVDNKQLEEEEEEEEVIDEVKVMVDLKDSMRKIIDYGQIPEGEATQLKRHVVEFRNLADKYDTSDEARTIRRGITKLFYPLYEKVFLRAYHEKNTDKVIDLFLRYGLLDETLLSKEQLIELYYLKEQVKDGVPCKVYNIRDWLVEIYEGRKEPSKSEFDLDYVESIREKKKATHMTAAEEKEYLNDTGKKLNYEIVNMFQCNNRLVNGQVSFFVPLLHSDLFVKSIKSTFITAAKVNYEISQLLEIDYSIFYRETLYFDHEKKIEKEYIQKEVFPDIILLPTSGINGVMWQEITGKKRDSSGRFLLPSFGETELEDMLIKVFGRFHWELCRSIQGTAWNNIKYKSLTSEYVDYIQFYRKNHDLSAETKERIKMQIQKGKSNSREIFVIDYVNWIKNESKGAIRLNKYVRDILAMYCPFKKSIREKLINQPLFAEAMARFDREHSKKIHENELRYKALEKEHIDLTEELIITRRYYNEL